MPTVKRRVVRKGIAFRTRSIYIDRRMAAKRRKPGGGISLRGGRKRVLVVLFVPSVERDGTAAIDQDRWVNEALETLGQTFGGATAYPKARGIWRDDDEGGALVRDEPVIVHCYTTPKDIHRAENLEALGAFCRKMGRDARQGEIGLVIGDEYFAIRDFEEESN